MLPQYDRDGYSKITGFSSFSYNCITYMMEKSESIWKLLFYNDADAYKKPNLTIEQKRSLIYAGQPDETLFRVFMSEKQPNAWIHEACVLRIYPYSIYPENRTINTTTIVIDTYTHYRIDTLSNYKTRTDSMVEELVGIFNGSNIGGLGRLFFNAGASRENRALDAGQTPYGGKRILMSTKQN